MGLTNTARASVLSIDTQGVDFNPGTAYGLQSRIAVIAQGSSASTYSSDKVLITSHAQAGKLVGFGSPAHLAIRELLPDNGDSAEGAVITLYPLQNDAAGAVAASGEVTPVGTQTVAAQYVIRVGGIESNPFAIAKDGTVADAVAAAVLAINGVSEMPVTAVNDTTKVTITAKHTGTTGNNLKIEVLGTPQGITFGITNMTGGLIDPDTNGATAQFGNVWETMIINAVGESALDDLQLFGDGRWGKLVKKPLVSFYGSSETSVPTLVAAGDARRDDRVNSIIVCPGSPSAPWIIAAKACSRVAKQANIDPASEYQTETLNTIVNGKDGEQFDYDSRDLLWKAGISSTVIENGVIQMSNTLTHYHPENEPNPKYGKVIYIVKLQQIIHNLNILFDQPSWKKAPLITDADVSTNRNSRKPSDFVAALNALTDSLADAAILTDRAFTKKNTVVTINAQNPNRVDPVYPVKLSGNVDINSIDLLFGFYLGGA